MLWRGQWELGPLVYLCSLVALRQSDHFHQVFCHNATTGLTWTTAFESTSQTKHFHLKLVYLTEAGGLLQVQEQPGLQVPGQQGLQKWDPVSKHKAKGKQNVLLSYFVTGRRSWPAHIARGIVIFAKERKVRRKSGKQRSILPLINSFSKVTVTGSALLICKILSHLESTYPEISVVVYM